MERLKSLKDDDVCGKFFRPSLDGWEILPG